MIAEVITVTAERACGVDATALMEDLDRDLLARYPPTSIHAIDAAQVDATGVFLVARRDGRAVGCGALRPFAPGIAEVKRMFVRDGARRRGIARRILGALEALARERDVVVLRLETGTRQPESIALYESAGYVPEARRRARGSFMNDRHGGSMHTRHFLLPPTVSVCRVVYDKRIVSDPRHDEVRRIECE